MVAVARGAADLGREGENREGEWTRLNPRASGTVLYSPGRLGWPPRRHGAAMAGGSLPRPPVNRKKAKGGLDGLGRLL